MPCWGPGFEPAAAAITQQQMAKPHFSLAAGQLSLGAHPNRILRPAPTIIFWGAHLSCLISLGTKTAVLVPTLIKLPGPASAVNIPGPASAVNLPGPASAVKLPGPASAVNLGLPNL